MTLFRDGWYRKAEAEDMLAFLAETHGVTPVCVSSYNGATYEVVYEAENPALPNHKQAIRFIKARDLFKPIDINDFLAEPD